MKRNNRIKFFCNEQQQIYEGTENNQEQQIYENQQTKEEQQMYKENHNNYDCNDDCVDEFFISEVNENRTIIQEDNVNKEKEITREEEINKKKGMKEKLKRRKYYSQKRMKEYLLEMTYSKYLLYKIMKLPKKKIR